jgi:hypothetical protein
VFVLTVDQVASRRGADRVPEITDRIEARHGPALVLGPDRTAGDEFQVVLGTAEDALGVAFELLRDGGWSVGLGIGPVRAPLPATTREAQGDAFVAARRAIDEAKRRPLRFALAATAGDALVGAAEVAALVDLLLDLRDRRTPEGWEVADRLEAGRTQADIAAELGITPQAVSLRARAAGVRLEQRARPALVRLVAALDVAAPA